MTQPLLDIEQAAAMLNISPFTLRGWVQRGQVPVIRLSRKAVRFDPATLQRWVDEHAVEVSAGVS